MYGSSRLGIVYPPKDNVIYDTQFGSNWDAPVEQMNVGLKRYEISNHLGNVLATITDRPVGVDSITTNESVEYFEPTLASASDYYPFGMLMPGRNLKSQVYPSGFNGKENDNEIKGVGNSLDFGARMYDSRLGRWMSVDAFEKKYPNLSSYTAMGNNPNLFVDKDGNDIVLFGKASDGKFYPIFTIVSSNYNIAKYTDAVVNLNHNGTPIPNPSFVLPSLSNVDGYLGSIGVDFAFGGGGGGALQVGIIEKGKDKGVFFYKAINANIGLGAGAGGSFGPIDFNENSGKELNRYTFTGLSQGYSIGIGAVGYSKWTSYVNGQACGPIADCGPILYTADMISGAAGPADFGGMYSFSKATIIENWSIPMKIPAIDAKDEIPSKTNTSE